MVSYRKYKRAHQRNNIQQQHKSRIDIPAFDIHNKEFGSRTDNEIIVVNVYELRTSPGNVAILKIILCKASHPDNPLLSNLFHMEFKESQTKTSTTLS